MVFREHGFTCGGQELAAAFSAAVCNVQAMKHYIEFLTITAER